MADEWHDERRVPVYGCLAPYYDSLIGDSLYPAIRDSFERCRRKLGLRFKTAADIGCGTGRFLRHLLRYGAQLIGVDASVPILHRAARRLQNRDVLLLSQDMRRLRLPYPVDLITCNGDTLNYLLRRRDLAQAILCCCEYLTPGGYLIGDFLSGVPTAEGDRKHYQCIYLPGLRSWWAWQALPAQRMTRVTIRFSFATATGWRRALEVHWQRWYQWRELRELLLRAGLSQCQVWAMPVNGGAGPGGGWLKFAARRPRR